MKRAVLVRILVIFIGICLSFVPVHGQERRQRISSGVQRPGANMGRLLIQLMDLDKDRRISGGEYMRFFADADQNKDGFMAQAEVMKIADERLKETTDTDQEADGLKVGQLSPDFTLPTLDGTGTVTLSSFRRRRKPVVLVFGSYT